jgi:hypothetical protein
VYVRTKLAELYQQSGREAEAEHLREAVKKVTQEVLEGPLAKRAVAASSVDAKLREIKQLQASISKLWEVWLKP